jgi:hypothetical protein
VILESNKIYVNIQKGFRINLPRVILDLSHDLELEPELAHPPQPAKEKPGPYLDPMAVAAPPTGTW